MAVGKTLSYLFPIDQIRFRFDEKTEYRKISSKRESKAPFTYILSEFCFVA